MAKASKPTEGAVTVDQDEAARFDALAADWWDPDGPMKPLHTMTPARMGYVRDALCGRFDRDRTDRHALAGLAILDIGCGAGLASEPLARLGARVTGMDAAPAAIDAARSHADACGIAIDYRVGGPENLPADSRFDAVVALEVLEHVADLPAFLFTCRRLLPSGGLFAFSTLNRTAASWATAIFGAERLLKLVPSGTHDWQRFIRPEDLRADLELAGFKIGDISGLVPDPLHAGWRIGRSTAVNYIGWATAV